MIVSSTKKLSAQDFLALPETKLVELVDGQPVEKNMGARSSRVGGQVYHLLEIYLEHNPVGHIFPADCGFHCFIDRPELVRKPDVAFVRTGRFENEVVPEGFITMPPDLAVEVISPNDISYEVADKVEEYLSCGVKMVWVINPEDRTVIVYRANGSIVGLRPNDEISGEDVVAGFHCRVQDFFARLDAMERLSPSNGS